MENATSPALFRSAALLLLVGCVIRASATPMHIREADWTGENPVLSSVVVFAVVFLRSLYW
jgi:hypothetical protein